MYIILGDILTFDFIKYCENMYFSLILLPIAEHLQTIKYQAKI